MVRQHGYERLEQEDAEESGQPAIVEVAEPQGFPDQKADALEGQSRRATHVQVAESASCSDRCQPFGIFRRCCRQLQGWIWGNGLASIATASVIMAINSLLIKLVVARVPSLELVATRGIFCWCMSVTIGRLRGLSSLYGQRENYVPLLSRGVTGALSMCAYYFALQYLPLGDTVTLFFFNPVLTCILAWALLGESITRWGMLGILTSLVGVVCVAQPPFLMGGDSSPWTLHHTLGVVLAIAAAFAAAAAFVSIRFMSKRESALSIAMWFHMSSIIMSIVPLAFQFPDRAVVPEPLDALIMLFVGASSFFGQLLLGRGYQLELASKVAAVNYLQVLFATFFSIVILGDSVSWLGMFGSLMIAAGVVLANASKSPAVDKGTVKVPTGVASVMPGEHKLLDASAGHLVMPHYSAGQHLNFASAAQLVNYDKVIECRTGTAVASDHVLVELSPVSDLAQR